MRKFLRETTYVPATKKEASRLRIASATTLTARSCGVTLRALLGEALLRAGRVAVDMREGAVLEHDFAGGDFREVIVHGHAVDFVGRPAVRVDRHRYSIGENSRSAGASAR